METKELFNGIQIPSIGFGTAQVPDGNVTKDSVKMAIKLGYRNIDTAAIYLNEEGVGQGIKEAMEEYGIKREDIFISTKVWNTHRSYDKALEAFEESINKLGLDYIDLYLIHWPAVEKWHDDWREINHDTWKALEHLYKIGKVKAIGVSNYLTHHLEALIEFCEIKPMVNQIEYHPGFYQKESAEFCLKNDIVVEAWSPFGTGEVLNNEVLLMLANKYNKQPAHICLRWIIQKGIIPLTKSTHQERIASNLEVFDFELSHQEMEMIDDIPYCGGMAFNPDEAQS